MKLFILDALALAYRAHFAFISRPRITSRGENTSASYGFTTALLKLINDFGIDHVVTVFDVIGEEAGTFRDDLFSDYKAHREPPPEALLANLPYIKQILDAMGVPYLEVRGYEADDVIATLARRAVDQGHEAVIVSADKDFLQLLAPGISIFKPARQGDVFDILTAEVFRENTGLEPAQFADVLALMGDKADNVPGVTGIGEKTAVKLIQEYGDVETLLERAEEVSGKRAREGLLAEAENARLSKQLVTLVSDLDVPFDWERARRTEPNWSELDLLFQQLEFRALLDRMLPEDQRDAMRMADADESLSTFDPELVRYRDIRERRELENWIKRQKPGHRLAIETLVASRTDDHTTLIGIGLSPRERDAVFVPVPLPDGTSASAILEELQPVLDGARLVGRRTKEDILLFESLGCRVRPDVFDVTVAHYLIAPEQRHNIDLLARSYLSYAIADAPDESKLEPRPVNLETVGHQVAERADIVGRLESAIRKELEEHDLKEVATRIEMPLIAVLADMEHAGIRVDTAMLRDIGQELDREIAGLETEIFEAAGEAFTIGSPQQLAEILYTRLGLPVRSKTSTGQPSTREMVLQELATEHRLPGLILDWRRASKLKSTYVDALEQLVDRTTGRLHTQFNQTVTATGRLSSSNPNLQNIPVRREQGRQLRRAFVPEQGWLLLSADYVQIELRILASMSGDEALIDAFSANKDIHQETAARIFGIDAAGVTRAQRSKAKEVNYGIPYGISAFGLAQRLRVPRQEAQALIDAHRKLYPGVWKFLSSQVEKARERGYAETMLGRRRYLPRIDARNRAERSAAERIAVNMPIQGTQADMIKLAMVHIHSRLREEGLKARLLLQVHDELVMELPPEEEADLRALVKQGMTEALELGVPVDVEINVGPNWLEVH